MSYGKFLTAMAVLGALIGPAKAQEQILDGSLEIVGSRQCAIAGTELHVFLKERLPDCNAVLHGRQRVLYTLADLFGSGVFLRGS